MFRLRKKNPPFGTVEAPLWEYAYSEQVKVVDGLCDVNQQSTKDYLLKLGYEEIAESEFAGVAQTVSDPPQDDIETSSLRTSSNNLEKKKRR
jgi:hypothetical protein